jgi:hypothetical protein
MLDDVFRSNTPKVAIDAPAPNSAYSDSFNISSGSSIGREVLLTRAVRVTIAVAAICAIACAEHMSQRYC